MADRTLISWAPLRSGATRTLAVLALAACFAAVTAGEAVARARAASGPTKTVRFHGYRLTVPVGWPVIRLANDPTACVRFDRHAVYLGIPGAAQRCPAHAAGRTEAILVEPLVPAARAGVISGPGSAARLVDRAHGVAVTATWGAVRGLVELERALGTRALRPLPAGTPVEHPAREGAAPHARAAAASAPGGVYTGLGFDPCSTPSASAMSAWSSSPYRAVGVYLGGTNMACSQPNLTASWVATESAAGWHLIPIYVGLQAPTNSCGCAAITPPTATSQGAAAASDAVARAQAVGLGAGNPIYFDMEAYTRNSTNTSAVLAFLSSWTAQLHASGYKSGVYSSADSGIIDLAAQYGTTYLEPDDIWVARWNEVQSTAEPNVPSTDWAAHQRIHQYDGGHNETHGGVTINIDGDYLDAATAAAGSGTAPGPAPPPVPTAPNLSVAAAPDGGIELSPSWSGGVGVSSWQLVGGPAPTSLAPVTIPLSASTRTPIVVHNAFAYFAAVALDANGLTLGSSPAVPTPPHVAIVGNSAFVPSRGPGGLPVGCFNAAPCQVSTRITAGRTTVASTGSEHVPVGGGLVYFKLTTKGRALLSHARRHRLAVRITVRDASGASATRALTLIPFATSGRGPSRRISQAPGLHIVGATDFVSGVRVGGILAGCFAAATCHPSATITADGRVIARTSGEFLGVNELGYLIFSLTGAGQRMLAAASGNQLGATVTLSDGAAIARAQIALVSFR